MPGPHATAGHPLQQVSDDTVCVVSQRRRFWSMSATTLASCGAWTLAVVAAFVI